MLHTMVAAVIAMQSLPCIVDAQSVDIAPMTWTQRSDWVNVKTDAALSLHAVGDGIADDTAAIQAALDIVSTSSDKSVVYLPAGTYRITDTLYWTTGQWCISGKSLYGCGSDTTVVWDGVSDGIMFLSTGNAKGRYYGIRWDGNNIAATGMYFEPRFLANPAQGYAEAPTLHYNQAFLNFTGVALDFRNRSHTEWTGETEIRNCLFYNSAFGSQIGRDNYNNYEYIFEACHFEDCGTGIDSGKNAAQMVYNCRFEGSSVTDLTGESSIRARHCISTGSKLFLRVPEYQGAGGRHAIQDCWIDSWTNLGTGFNGGAIRIDKRAHSFVFDCKFTNAPNTEPPVNMVNKSFDIPNNILVSNNLAAGFSTQFSMVNTGTGGGSANVLAIEASPYSDDLGVTTILEDPNYVFLDATPIHDSANVIDVTQAPYFADKTNVADASSAIQAAINAARTANNGSIVYLPTGHYRIDETLSVAGGNYSIEGSGYKTECIWNGDDAGVMFSVDTPNAIGLRHLQFKMPESKIATVGIYVTASSAANLVIREVYHRVFFGSNITSIGSAQPYPGIVLDGLPEGSFVYLNTINVGGLTMHECGAAQILGQNGLPGKITVDGVSASESGMIGFTYMNAMVIAGVAYLGSDTGAFDIDINDNQSFIVADYYNEQAYNNLYLSNGSGTESGRVTFQGFRRESVNDNTAIYVDDYIGRLFYSLQLFENREGSVYKPSKVEHVGSNPFELVLVMNTFNYDMPTFSLGQGASLISQFNKTVTPPNSPPVVHTLLQNTPVVVTTAEEQSIRAGLDHLQEFGLFQLKYHTGLAPTSPFVWSDRFDGISGVEILNFSGGVGAYRNGTLHPQSGPVDYFLWYSGGTAFDVGFGAELNAVDVKPGLVFANLSGHSINTNFAGFSSEEIDIASVMGWQSGQITKEQIGALRIYFDYSLNGFANSMVAGVTAAGGSGSVYCIRSFGASPSGVSDFLELRTFDTVALDALSSAMNDNGGHFKFTVRIPAGNALAGARLAIADLEITLPFSWYDDLTQTTGLGDDAINLTGGSGHFSSDTLQPNGAYHDYFMYYQGGSAYDWHLIATSNCIGSRPGLILTNQLGSTVSTVFGGISVKQINIASLMGWTVGQITAADVAKLRLDFEYQISGFSNVFSIGLSAVDGASSSMILKSCSVASNPTHASYDINTASQAQRENMAQILNGNGGNLNITTLLPSGSAVAGAELRLANIVVVDQTQF